VNNTAVQMNGLLFPSFYTANNGSLIFLAFTIGKKL